MTSLTMSGTTEIELKEENPLNTTNESDVEPGNYARFLKKSRPKNSWNQINQFHEIFILIFSHFLKVKF